MEPIANETWRSFTRSRYRRRLLVLLSSLGEAYVGQLGRMLGLPHSRVAALLEGNVKAGYAEELAIVKLGLARRRETAAKRGRVYEITAKGRRKARSLTAGSARRAQAASADEAARVTDPPPMERTGAVEGSGDGTSVSWRVDG